MDVSELAGYTGFVNATTPMLGYTAYCSWRELSHFVSSADFQCVWCCKDEPVNGKKLKHRKGWMLMYFKIKIWKIGVWVIETFLRERVALKNAMIVKPCQTKEIESQSQMGMSKKINWHEIVGLRELWKNENCIYSDCFVVFLQTR